MNALLVIDIQESFRTRPNWQQVSNPDIVFDANKLVRSFRDRGDLVVWVLHAEPGSAGPFDPELGHVRLQDGLVPEAGEPVLTKTSRNAFTTTELCRILQHRGIREVTICGIQTEQCCETTARVAADLGFDVVFVTDATATFPIVRPDTGATLSTREVIERTEFALAGRFAKIATVGQIEAQVEAEV